MNLSNVSPQKIQNQAFTSSAETGVANLYLLTMTPAITSYVDGQMFVFSPANENTSASTMDINSVGSLPIETLDGNPLSGGELIPNAKYLIVYSAGINAFILINPSTNNQYSTKTILTPSSGSTVNLTVNIQRTILNPGGALATLTVNLPFPVRDQKLQTISTTQAITSLTVGSQGTDTVVAAPTALTAGQSFTMIYDFGTASWYPG
jgi:hypothetical protein